MDFITTKDAAAKWGISGKRITVLASEGRIPGAYRLGKSWLIPANATKPEAKKPSRTRSAKTLAEDFSFPLYHFRPDWSSANEALLNEQQLKLLQAETAVMECRFADAYAILENILHVPDSISTEVGCLWYAGLCSIALNKADDFSKHFLRMQMLLSEDFPHRDDYAIILNALKTYVVSIGSSASSETSNMNCHIQCLPLACLNLGYSHLAREGTESDTADVAVLELNLRLLEITSALVAVEMMHIYLLGIYYLRHDAAMVETHAKAVVQIAYENKLYFPLITYYRYFTPAFAPVLAQYPEDFRRLCDGLIEQYEQNLTAFSVAANEDGVIVKLSDTDYPYIFGVLTGQTYTQIAEKLGVHSQTAARRIAALCEKLGVKNKSELRDYLRRFM